MDPDAGPRQLQNKVMFDIRFYFCRRGGENIEEMKKDTFSLEFDSETSIAFVKKVRDEMTKNRRDTDNEIVTGFMPQILTPDGRSHKMCPVRSFENYIGSLNPGNNRLWQRPKSSVPNGNIWYENRPVGHGPIDNFMADLSGLCNLSKRYTNHCIRVTGVTTLRRGHFNEKQVMSVTGHRSIQSLAIYQRVQADEKLRMGMCLTYSLFHPHQALQIKQAMIQEIEEAQQDRQDFEPPGPQPLCAPILPALPPVPIATTPQQDAAQPQIPSLDSALVPCDQPHTSNTENNTPTVPDFDISKIIQEFQNSNDDEDLLLAATQIEKENFTSKTTMMKKTSSPNIHPRQVFQNCSFGNIGSINIHVHKH